MLTVLDAISLAGDRAGQNDDAYGVAPGAAWVIDGATDLDAPLTDAASDAAWVARAANAALHAHADIATVDPAALVTATAKTLRAAFARFADPNATPAWRWPLAALLLVQETADGLVLAEVGDCRLFAAGSVYGGRDRGKDDEIAAAAVHAADSGGARYKSEQALAFLRSQRGGFYDPGPDGHVRPPFGVDPRCGASLRLQRIALPRPAHLLLATDGFAALSDVYGAYDPAGLVVAARTLGLAALGQELRAIETSDAAGARHPRWKRSDDATAILLRLD